MSDFWIGVVTPFAVIGGMVAASGLIWLVVIMWPEGVWWTVKRLPLGDRHDREHVASVVAAARRVYTLRIANGLRLTLSLGESRETRDELIEQLRRGRETSVAPLTSPCDAPPRWPATSPTGDPTPDA